jgi:hypothetical protein
MVTCTTPHMKEMDIHLLSAKLLLLLLLCICGNLSPGRQGIDFAPNTPAQQRQGCANKPEQNNNDGHQIPEREPFRSGPLCRRNA